MCSSFTLSIRYLIDEARVWQKIGGNNREAHLNDIQSVSQNAMPPVESQLETKTLEPDLLRQSKRDRYYATLCIANEPRPPRLNPKRIAQAAQPERSLWHSKTSGRHALSPRRHGVVATPRVGGKHFALPGGCDLCSSGLASQ